MKLECELPKKKVCSNCKNSYIEGDKYCRFCGAPMGTPVYIEDNMPCIYGPMPVKRIHSCDNCGFLWETCLMVDRERWCPQCGGKAPGIAENKSFSDLQKKGY